MHEFPALDYGAHQVDAVVVGEVQQVRCGENYQVGLLADFDRSDALTEAQAAGGIQCRRGQGLFDR